jgi:hypothetical protein
VRTDRRDLHFVRHHIQTAGTFRRRTAAACKQPRACVMCGLECVGRCVWCFTAWLRGQEATPAVFVTICIYHIYNHTVTVNTAPLWSLQECSKNSCIGLQCYFRYVSAFARPSSGKLLIYSMRSDCCLNICIKRPFIVGYCINAGG